MDTTLEQRLQNLVEIFLDENSRINLSGHRTPEACWDGNVRDSLAYVEIHEKLNAVSPIHRILDIGTGGGFPAMPLALALPDITVTAVDSTRKKIDAVRRIIERVSIPNLKTIVGRTEDLGHDVGLREKFDAVMARGVAALSPLLEYCSPFVRGGGWIVLWKSMTIESELAASERAQRLLHCTLQFSHSYDLGGTWGTRQLLVFKKAGTLPKIYPRAVGTPTSDPL